MPWVLLAGSSLIIAYAAVTLPRRRSQLAASLAGDAVRKARLELKQSALAVARSWANEQLEGLRGHADRERTRWVRHLRARHEAGASMFASPASQAELEALAPRLRYELQARLEALGKSASVD